MTMLTNSDRILAPLLATAQRLDWPQRRAFLDDLRHDAPVMMAEVERLLALRGGTAADLETVPRPGLFARVRQLVHRRVNTTPQ